MAAIKSPQIERLQRTVGTTVDGIFGPKTLRAAATYYNLTPSQAAHFFGQINEETGGFTVFVENLNYSAGRLLEIFPKYFTVQEAQYYAGKPEMIANRVYANRMGNGNECSGDGWKYRGRGFIQLTGANNYRRFGEFLGIPELVEQCPEKLENEFAMLAAMWFFSEGKIWDIAKHGVTDDIITRVTKIVNGGTIRLDVRKQKTYQYYNWLK